jgi:hypothetical protein
LTTDMFQQSTAASSFEQADTRGVFDLTESQDSRGQFGGRFESLRIGQ